MDRRVPEEKTGPVSGQSIDSVFIEVSVYSFSQWFKIIIDNTTEGYTYTERSEADTVMTDLHKNILIIIIVVACVMIDI